MEIKFFYYLIIFIIIEKNVRIKKYDNNNSNFIINK